MQEICYNIFMNEFLKMDIFFFIASIGTVLLTVLLIILLVYLIKILKDVKEISREAKIEAEYLVADIENLRADVKAEGFRLKHAIKFINSIFKKQRKGK